MNQFCRFNLLDIHLRLKSLKKFNFCNTFENDAKQNLYTIKHDDLEKKITCKNSIILNH